MEVQVEHLEGHVAQLTVTVEEEETLASKKKAARRLAKKVRIPGFRPGKAPYQVIVNMLGDGAILEEALEEIGQQLYVDALDKSDVDPAAPGSFVDFKEEDGQLILTYEVPKQAIVDLKDYRDIREPLEVEAVTDEMVSRALESLRDQRAVVEDADRPAQIDDEVELDIAVTWWHEEDHDHDDEAEEAESESEADDDDDEDEEAESEADAQTEVSDDDDDGDHDHGHSHTLIDDREADVILRAADDDRDLMPGFSEHVVGLSEGDEKAFELVMPDDFEDERLAGETVDVALTVNKVRNRTLPELNDTFAASATQGEQETLLELRVKIRSDLEEAAENAARQDLFVEVMEKIAEQAEVTYHEVMVDTYVEDMLRSMDATIQQQANMKLDDFLHITGQSMDDLRASRREEAKERLIRDVILIEVADQERIRVEEADVDAEIEKMVEPFGEQSDTYRKLFDTPDQRDGLRERVLMEKLLQRVVDISTGNAPPLEEIQAAADEDAEESASEPVTEE